MRPKSVAVAFPLLVLAIAPAGAQERGIIDPDRARRPAIEDFRSILEQLNPLPPREPPKFTIEGLPGDRPQPTLTWERAYALALVRSRDPGRPPAPTLDPATLDEQARQVGVGDFARFREDFLAQGGRFRDPSTRHFDALWRRLAARNAVHRLVAFENLLSLCQELIRGESAGLTQIHVDQINEAIQRARLDLLDRQMRYRDAFDELKIELGLSPQARAVLDPSPLARFASTFEDVLRWSGDPSRELQKLDEITRGLPELGDVSISGRSLLEGAAAPFPGEDLVEATSGLAKGGLPAVLEARKRVRKLAELAVAYRIEQRRFLLTLRVRSMAQERLLAPPQPGAPAGFEVANLINSQDQLCTSEDRLVEVWTSYHALRLAFLRDLQILPVETWKAFHDRMLGGKDDPARPRPVSVVQPPQPPPAPPAPPGLAVPDAPR